MSLRFEIETTFQNDVFKRPLFYSYHQGLRFELSEGGSSIEQFLCALRKALTICQDIFDSEETLPVCLRIWSYGSRFAHRQTLRELRDAGIRPPKQRFIWTEKNDEDEDSVWLNLAFNIPKSLLQNILWCALALDLGVIRPNPRCSIYLFNLNKKLAIFPYDDRGMDVVGEITEHLSTLFDKYNNYLLDYDREKMNAKFANP